MVTWRAGVEAIRSALSQPPEAAEQFLRDLAAGSFVRTPGTMVFLTRSTQKVPRLVLDHVRFLGALPENVITLNVIFEDTPRCGGPACQVVNVVAEGWWQVVARFGFMEIPDLRRALRAAHGLGPSLDLDTAVFVASRDLVVHRKGSKVLRRGRLGLFAFLYRNAVKAVDRFNLPPRNVVEIARQIEI
jgi:KUP system potassium uptake protein